ncbi:MAG: glycosyl hydrolase family 28 protein [Acidobacteriaceae bacterium]|nr:glycosyl hydrolase family 28 protein [Acidobacteriaceae bacterium]
MLQVQKVLGGLWACAMVASMAGAQTLATGDSRTVTEPIFPVACTVLTAQQAIVGSGPASETVDDTSRVQAALTACASGKAVELAGGGGKYAFLTSSLNLPSGVSLIVDGGVTLFASRKASDYQVSGATETCGSYGASGNACKYFLYFNNGSANTGSGVYGYGVIDLRGNATILNSAGVDTGISWWTNADSANTAGQSQDNVSFMKPSKSSSLTFYKITIRSSPNFHIVTSNVSGETIWGVKIQAPFTSHNTDGIDPQGTNVTVKNSYVSVGDDAIAVSGSSNSSNITVANSYIYASHGISIGSYTQGGVSNMLVQNVNMAGQVEDGNQNGLRIKSSIDRGGVVQNITYQNVCLRDIARPVYVTPLYNSNSGTLYPSFQNIVFQNIHLLAPTATRKYTFSIAGYSANYLTTATLNNVVSDQAMTYSPALTYATIALAGNVYPASLQTQAGTGLTYTGSATAAATPAYDCSATATVFPALVGELFGATATATNLNAATVAGGASVTLNAMLQPTRSQATFNGTVGNYTGAAAPTAAVSFYEGMTLLGTGTLGANGTNSSLASLVLSNLAAGTHTITATYPGDTTYGALNFGSFVVTVSGPTLASATTLTATSTVAYGTAASLSVSVAASGGASGTPTGTVTISDGGTQIAQGTLASGAYATTVMLAGGAHSLSATYGGDTSFLTSSTSAVSTLTVTTVAPLTFAVTANPVSIASGASTTVTATLAGGSGMATPAGTVTLTEGGATVGTITLSNGSGTTSVTLNGVSTHTITAAYSGDANYSAASTSASVTVTTIATTTVLALSKSATYVGASMSLTATVTPAVSGATVTFATASGTLGTAVTNASGVATLAATAPAAGTYAVTATMAATGSYAASTSSAQTLTVSAPLAVVTTPNPVSVSAGGSGSVVATMTPGGGFTGTLTATCVSSVSYVTCSPASSSVAVTGASAVTSTLTISVAATTSAVRGSDWRGVEYAGLLMLTLFGARKRRGMRLMMVLLLGIGLAGMSGCGGGSSSSSTGTKPSGSQTVTYTLNGGGLASSVVTTLVVNIQ